MCGPGACAVCVWLETLGGGLFVLSFGIQSMMRSCFTHHAVATPRFSFCLTPLASFTKSKAASSFLAALVLITSAGDHPFKTAAMAIQM